MTEYQRSIIDRMDALTLELMNDWASRSKRQPSMPYEIRKEKEREVGNLQKQLAASI